VNPIDNPAGRRVLLKAGIGLGIQLTLSGQENPAAARPKEGDLLVKVGDSTTTPLTSADIATDSKQVMAWAMDPSDKTVRSGSRLNRILLVRFPPETISAETKQNAADGVLAFSAICPHAGCDVSEWVPEDHTLFCACHASKFEPKNGARVLDGPAPRSLPALPLKLSEGKLVVAKPFTAKITFEQG
jgi:rieske iron-sulfur protein